MFVQRIFGIGVMLRFIHERENNELDTACIVVSYKSCKSVADSRDRNHGRLTRIPTTRLTID